LSRPLVFDVYFSNMVFFAASVFLPVSRIFGPIIFLHRFFLFIIFLTKRNAKEFNTKKNRYFEKSKKQPQENFCEQCKRLRLGNTILGIFFFDFCRQISPGLHAKCVKTRQFSMLFENNCAK